MAVVWIVLLGLLIGAVLGGLGGGGAILTVPVLVYVVDQSAQDATTSSLVIVGLTAAVGVLSYLSDQRVRWGLGLTFGLVGFPATFLGSYLNHRVDQNALLLGFAGVMVIAAAAMIGNKPRAQTPATTQNEVPAAASRFTAGDRAAPTRATGVLASDRKTHADPGARPAPVRVIVVALAVGLLTGFFGVGGGFVIVPALVLLLRISIQQAVGTSLMIVALNSATALVSRVGTAHFDWDVIVPFTLAAMLATLAGKRVADRLPARQLKTGFAALLVLVAAYTAWQSLDGLTHDDPATTIGQQLAVPSR